MSPKKPSDETPVARTTAERLAIIETELDTVKTTCTRNFGEFHTKFATTDDKIDKVSKDIALLGKDIAAHRAEREAQEKKQKKIGLLMTILGFIIIMTTIIILGVNGQLGEVLDSFFRHNPGIVQ